MNFLEDLTDAKQEIYYLHYLDTATFTRKCIEEAAANNEKKPSVAQMKIWFDSLKKFTAGVIKAKFVQNRMYQYACKTPESLCANGAGGRLYCANSVQSLWKPYRGLVFGKIGTDIDMVNAHPTILRWLCKRHKIDCPQLSYYCENRDDILSRNFSSKAVGKKAFLVATNTQEKLKTPKKQPKILVDYDTEMKKIQEQLISIPEYFEIQDSVPEHKQHNHNGSAINRIMCVYESNILIKALEYFTQKGLKVPAPFFDGCIAMGNHYENEELLKGLEEYIENAFPGLNMKWAYKEHDKSVIIPSTFDYEAKLREIELQEAEFASLKSYEEIKYKFELDHTKIIQKSIFILRSGNNIMFKTESEIRVSYKHLNYCIRDHDSDGNPVVFKKSFIERWLTDPDMKTYDDVESYPKPELCPKNVYNSWIPFECETPPEGYIYDENSVGLKFILNHIKILCNNDNDISKYIEKWFAHCIQYPEEKSCTIVPTFISNEGAGKTTLVDMSRKMFGKQKVLCTSEPSQHVWGKFNGLMKDAYFINLNELCSKETNGFGGKMKELITDPTLIVNEKGVKPYSMNSYHRYINTTNEDEPSKTTQGDRRNLFIRCSDEKVGNKEYFKELYGYVEDRTVIQDLYEYFKRMKDIHLFKAIPKPVTKYQETLMEGNRSYQDMWLEHYAIQHSLTKTSLIPASEVFAVFNDWISTNRISLSFPISSMSFGKKLGCMKVSGLESVKQSGVTYWKFDFQKLNAYYNSKTNAQSVLS